MTVNTILTGNSFSLFYVIQFSGKPLEFQFFRPSETTVEETNDHELIYTFRDRLNGKEMFVRQKRLSIGNSLATTLS